MRLLYQPCTSFATGWYARFLNLADGDVKSTTVGITIRFGPGGETVNEPTFSATLKESFVLP